MCFLLYVQDVEGPSVNSFSLLFVFTSGGGGDGVDWTGMATAQQYQNCEICKKERAEFQKKKRKSEKVGPVGALQ